MALITAATEQHHMFLGFAHELIPLKISPRQRLDDVVSAISGIPFGGTDCALPMVWALEHKTKVDVFVVYTDSETWFNPQIHPAQALQEYRQKVNPSAKLIVVGMTSNGFSIADPDDAGALDVVGFDSAVPSVMADFVRT
jgi:60 kDa SS-A/Ro ribonucleoprotein